MPQYDLPAHELPGYRPALPEPEDLAAFWEETLAQTRGHELAPTRRRTPTPLRTVETFDVTFSGFGGDRIRAWLHLPAAGVRADRPLPGVVQFQGYNGGRGLAHEHVFWAGAGYAHLVVDTRGQGSGWTVGDTGDPRGAGPAQPGFLTRGILEPEQYYYRRVYADAVRAVECLREQPELDGSAITVTGISQGGGVAIAAAALADGVAAVMPDVPFLCDFPRAMAIAPGDPYAELVRYLRAHRDGGAQALATLAYFDCALLAGWASAPALFSVALMDELCPPSTVYAAYNRYAGPKEIIVYPYNDHEGGEAFQLGHQAAWLGSRLHAAAPAPSPSTSNEMALFADGAGGGERGHDRP